MQVEKKRGREEEKSSGQLLQVSASERGALRATSGKSLGKNRKRIQNLGRNAPVFISAFGGKEEGRRGELCLSATIVLFQKKKPKTNVSRKRERRN